MFVCRVDRRGNMHRETARALCDFFPPEKKNDF